MKYNVSLKILLKYDKLEPDVEGRKLDALLEFVFLVSGDCCVALPRGAMGLSAIYDCGISLSYSLTFLYGK